jgi:hypothetical protein
MLNQILIISLTGFSNRRSSLRYLFSFHLNTIITAETRGVVPFCPDRIFGYSGNEGCGGRDVSSPFTAETWGPLVILTRNIYSGRPGQDTEVLIRQKTTNQALSEGFTRETMGSTTPGIYQVVATRSET